VSSYQMLMLTGNTLTMPTKAKRIETLKYMHRHSGTRGLGLEPEQWKWSSFRGYAHGERGPVLVNEQRPAEMKRRARQTFVLPAAHSPTL
jgi:hypothetical protein